MNSYDILIVGGGHAGCEAALAAARMGKKTLLITMSKESIARMSCNPAIGGLAKGHLVREIDALGGEMGKIADQTGIQFRMLNRSKGPAVWGPRAQSDKAEYAKAMRTVVEKQNSLYVFEGLADEILLEGNHLRGLRTKDGEQFLAKAIILTTGTFLRGIMHTGNDIAVGGRFGENAAEGLSGNLLGLGLELARLKTGTPPRLLRESIDFSKAEAQHGDNEPFFFSYESSLWPMPQVPCYITYTNEKTHRVIQDNLHRSPLYSGKIKGIGPRYCPSIEDKVVRFADKARHQIFLEPEGLNSKEIYVNGASTSLPADVQEKIIHSIHGLEDAVMLRAGYAVEYDFILTYQTSPSMECKKIPNLFLAGQINGTSGYEEAAAQGLMAGINAALKLDGKEPILLSRDEAYIGVLIDDLVTKCPREPYRMFTSRAEHRLVLRQDNADKRLMNYGYELGLITKEQFEKFFKKQESIERWIETIKNRRFQQVPMDQYLRRSEVNLKDVLGIMNEEIGDSNIENQVEAEIKYAGYIQREAGAINRMKQYDEKKIPISLSFQEVKGLGREAREKLEKVKPLSLGQASRISGVTPCDISLLAVYIEKLKRQSRT